MTADEAGFQALPSPQPHFPAPQNSTDICISHIPSEAVLSCFLEIISCRSYMVEPLELHVFLKIRDRKSVV